MKKIIIETIDPTLMRYPTVGDYEEYADRIEIRVADTGDWRYDMLIALHELAEKTINMVDGVTDQQVDDWDNAHLDSDEPGDLKGCPYCGAHWVASFIERKMCYYMLASWKKYSEAIEIVSEIQKRYFNERS